MVARGMAASAPRRVGEARPHRPSAVVTELDDVGTGREDPPPAPEHDRTRRVVLQAGGDSVQLRQHGAGQRVGLRAVQPDERDAVGASLHRDEGLSHGRTVPEPILDDSFGQKAFCRLVGIELARRQRLHGGAELLAGDQLVHLELGAGQQDPAQLLRHPVRAADRQLT